MLINIIIIYILYIMYKELLIYFFYFNIQFIFDLYYKSYQLDFLKSVETEININYFLIFNMFHFILLLIHIGEKHVNMYFLEFPIKKYIYYDVFSKIKNMPKIWLEQNSSTKIDFIISNAQNGYYNKYNTLIELYGSIIRVIMNTYILYSIYDKSVYLILIYFGFYLWFYNNIILNTREKVKKNITKSNKISLINKNLYLQYFNSCIGNYQQKYIDIINSNNQSINNYNLDNQTVDKIYLGSLQLFQKFLMFIFIYFYIKSNCIKKCSLFLLPLYQTTITLVYQFEYILHNYYGVINQDFTVYNDFIDSFNNQRNIIYINKNKPLHITYDLNYKNKNTLKINTNIDVNLNDRILIEGPSGIGKSSICKLISGYFHNYIKNDSDKILYITQNIYLYTENRTLYNVITDNDLNLYEEQPELLHYIIENIIPFNDIKNHFSSNYLNVLLESKSFSGGQEKRIYLAKWLYHLLININKYNIIILDEPDKSLDNNITYNLLYNILNEPKFNNLCIIVIINNINKNELFNKILNMEIIHNQLKLITKK